MKIFFSIFTFTFLLSGFCVGQAPDSLTIDGYILAKNLKTQKTREGLYVGVIKEGDGAQPRAGDYVKINYKGALLNGKVFDSSPAGDPFVFQLGYRQVVDALDIGVREMKAGSNIILLAPAILGYGQSAVQEIPANSPLLFEIELLEILTPVQYDQYMKQVEKKEREASGIARTLQLEKDKTSIIAYADRRRLKIQTTASGLSYCITKAAKSGLLKLGDEVSVEYEGSLLDDKIFDSNKGKAPFAFEIGAGRVIEGWDEGMRYFGKGGEGYLLIPSALAYGSNPLDDGRTVVPANSALVFKIKIKE